MKKKIILWIMQSSFYRWLLLNIIPYLRFTTYYPKADGRKFHEAYDLLQAGDVILTNDSLKLTSFLIPGEFSHAALCVSKDKKIEVIEMTHTNYTESTFAKVFFEADRVCIIRCPEISNDPDYLRRMIKKCFSFKHALYDIAFELGVLALYCSELIFQSDFEHRLKISLEDLAGIGRQYISPDGLYKAENIIVIYDTQNA